MDLTMLHDMDLRRLGTAEAVRVLDDRGHGARDVRIALARVFARPQVATARDWSPTPFLTESGTLGIVMITDGTAWDTGYALDPRVRALGLEGAGEVCAATTPGLQGTVSFDGVPVQAGGTAVVREGDRLRVVPPTAPDGWRQIGLMTWRGYEAGAGEYVEVPTSEYRPESWIRPALVATGLMTCYGKPGDRSGEFLDRTYGWDEKYPWGVPDWIDGRSVTVLDQVANGSGYKLHTGEALTLRRLGWDRGTDARELERVATVAAQWREATAERLVRAGTARNILGNPKLPAEIVALMTRTARAIAAGDDDRLRVAADAREISDAAGPGSDAYLVVSRYRALCCAEDAIAAGLPWEAAKALSDADAAGLLNESWPPTCA